MDRPLQEQTTTVRIPLIGSPETRLNTQSSYYPRDRYFLNCFPVKVQDAVTGDVTATVEARSGFDVSSTTFTGLLGSSSQYVPIDAIGMSQCDDVSVIALYDGSDSKYYICQFRGNAGTTTLLGTITGFDYTDFLYLTELKIGTTPYLGVVVHKKDYSSSKAYYAATSSGVFAAASLTEITDADFPPKKGTPEHLAGPMVQMNGTTYVLTRDGKIYNSDLNSISSWNALGFLSAGSYPDKGVALARYKHHIVAFGEDTMEFFNDVGNPTGSPLQRVEQSFIKIGLIHGKAMCNINDTIYWVSQSKDNNVGLYALDGYTPTKISQPAFSSTVFDNLMNQCNLQPIYMKGMQHIIFNLRKQYEFAPSDISVNASDTDTWGETLGNLTYCLDTSTWWYFAFDTQGTTSGYGGNEPYEYYYITWYNYTSSTDLITYMLVGSEAFVTGGVTPVDAVFGYPLKTGGGGNTSYVTDSFYNGTDVLTESIPVIISVPALDFETEKRKRIHKVKLIGDLPKDGTNSQYLYFIYLKEADQFNSGESKYTRDVLIPNSYNRMYWNNLGMARKWKFYIATKSKINLRLESLEIDISQGTA